MASEAVAPTVLTRSRSRRRSVPTGERITGGVSQTVLIACAVVVVLPFLWTIMSSFKTSRQVLQSPFTLHKGVMAMVEREIAHARVGKPARIIAKMNALLDGKTIEALYEASTAGVQIDLIVRGMCALRPGVPGLSERICVRSIIGRYLEHSRIFWFANGDRAEVFAGSADWMPRNLYERCEVVYPVSAPAAAHRLRHEILEAYLRDSLKSRLLQADGSYTYVPQATVKQDGKPILSAQDWFMLQSKAHDLHSTPVSPESENLKTSVPAETSQP